MSGSLSRCVPGGDPPQHRGGLLGPGRDVVHHVLRRPPLVGDGRLVEPLGRHVAEHLGELEPPLVLLGEQPLDRPLTLASDPPRIGLRPMRTSGRWTSGRNSNVRSEMRISSPRRAPGLGELPLHALLDQPAAGGRRAARSSSRSVSWTHRSTLRPTTRQPPALSSDREPRPARPEHDVRGARRLLARPPGATAVSSCDREEIEALARHGGHRQRRGSRPRRAPGPRRGPPSRRRRADGRSASSGS